MWSCKERPRLWTKNGSDAVNWDIWNCGQINLINWSKLSIKQKLNQKLLCRRRHTIKKMCLKDAFCRWSGTCMSNDRIGKLTVTTWLGSCDELSKASPIIRSRLKLVEVYLKRQTNLLKREVSDKLEKALDSGCSKQIRKLRQDKSSWASEITVKAA